MSASAPLQIPRVGQFSKAQADALFRHGQQARHILIPLLGQSNNAGGGNSGPVEARPGEADALDERVFIWSQSGNKVPAKQPIHQLPVAINVDNALALGKHVAHLSGGSVDVVLVPCAVGGTSFATNNWNPPSDTEFAASVTRINAALAALENPYIAGFGSILGETDAANGSSAIEAFLEKHLAWIDAYRSGAHLNDDVLGEHRTKPFVVGTLIERGGDPIGPAAVGRIRINDRLRRLALLRDNVFCVELTDLTANTDQTHYTTDEQREIGRRFGQALTGGFRPAREVTALRYPTPALRIYADATNNLFTDIKIDDNRGEASAATLSAAGVAPVSFDGDGWGHTIGFGGAGGIDVSNFTLPTQGYSMAAWIYPTLSASNSQTIIGPQTNATYAPGHEFRIQWDAGTSQHLLNGRTQSNAGVIGFSPIASAKWMHVALIAQPSPTNALQSLSLFVNGIFQGVRGQANTGDGALRIGRNVAATTFVGFMDEVTVWEDPLSPTQIISHMQATMGGNQGPFQSI